MTDIVTECAAEMRAARAFDHPFLAELRDGSMDSDGAKRFAIQWYKAASAHKKSFPGLIYNTPDDRIRLQLIEILREEYGYGEADRVHGRLLEKFVMGLGLSLETARNAPTEPEVSKFSADVDDAWTRGDPIEAFGVHFALEFLAANMHKAFFAGVQTISGLTDDDVEYFRLHSVAEEEHSAIAEEGMRILARTPANSERLSDGVQVGTMLVETLLDGLQRAYKH